MATKGMDLGIIKLKTCTSSYTDFNAAHLQT